MWIGVFVSDRNVNMRRLDNSTWSGEGEGHCCWFWANRGGGRRRGNECKHGRFPPLTFLGRWREEPRVAGQFSQSRCALIGVNKFYVFLLVSHVMWKFSEQQQKRPQCLSKQVLCYLTYFCVGSSSLSYSISCAGSAQQIHGSALISF
jgi:hypothetical protein